LIAAVMAVLPNRLERACPSEIVVIESPIQTNELPYLTKFNERWRRKPPAESIALDEAENQAFLGFKFGSTINLEKNVVFQQLPRGGAAIFRRHTVWRCTVIGPREISGRRDSGR
jgi:hypothetical protein